MKDSYKKCKEDLMELKDILMNSEELTVNPKPAVLCLNGMPVEYYKVLIDGEATLFTAKLYKWLVDNEVILRVD